MRRMLLPRRFAPSLVLASAITTSETADHDGSEWAVTMSGTRSRTQANPENRTIRLVRQMNWPLPD